MDLRLLGFSRHGNVTDTGGEILENSVV
ncbi:hypothetical protein C5167_037323 [Papaver somniferum]|uniref:Uncharacterized protein n=1 Tax=Papaver somniferum TaxID=3469 RepID=A0A4Y7I6C7_PAPSO|nr:hypothetical protein C5167_037323 [Papaver somniferum]